jgi:predicted oxidoreductase
MTERVDVVVLGSGVAGLSAAFEAARAGAVVLVLEAAERIGGASSMSGAACCLVGTPEQDQAGITDSVELALADWSALGGPTADLEWAGRYLRASRPEVHDWVERELGITWGAPMQPEGNSVPRWHLPSTFGVGIVEALRARCAALGVGIRTGTPATGILVDDGRVTGVRVAGVEIAAGAVVVATGGFVASRELLHRHAPQLDEFSRLLLGGSPTALGLGHALLEDAGADFVAMDHIWVYPNGTPDPSDPTGARGLGLRGTTTELWFNLESARFFDERHRGGHSGTRALLAQPGQSAWCVFDAADLPNVLLIDNERYATPHGPIREAMAEFWRESPFAVIADDPAELARRAGLDPAKVAAAIDAFNAAIAAGLDEDPATGRPLAGVAPLGREGYVALRFFPLAQKNFGGVRTDLDCRVLTPAGAAIPGLYAAGEVAGMAGGSINGRSGLEGTMFGPSLYSGRLAGASAAAGVVAA